jgi:hypothetical protein
VQQQRCNTSANKSNNPRVYPYSFEGFPHTSGNLDLHGIPFLVCEMLTVSRAACLPPLNIFGAAPKGVSHLGHIPMGSPLPGSRRTQLHGDNLSTSSPRPQRGYPTNTCHLSHTISSPSGSCSIRPHVGNLPTSRVPFPPGASCKKIIDKSSVWVR